MHTLNLGILAHVDAGKTSLTERLLYDAGVLDAPGSVDAGTTLTDSMDLERRRGITIRSAVASFAVDDVAVNVVDTPGHPDFIAEVERALVVLDGAVLVLSAVEGVQPQTVVIWRALRRLGVPTLLFVNKADRAGADPARVLSEVRRRLDPYAVSLSRVDGAGSAAVSVRPRPPEDAAVVEGMAERDDRLLDLWAAGRRIPRPLAVRALRGLVASARLSPVLAGSAVTGAGVPELTGAITAYLPRAGDRPGAGNRPGEPSGVVFAVDRDERGKHATVRLWSGTLGLRDRLGLGGRDPERVTGLRVHAPGGPVEARSTSGGQIAVLTGLVSARIGDTFGPRPQRAAREHHFPPATLEAVVDPVRDGQRGALFDALTELAERDPLIALRSEDARREIVVSLYGEVQKEVLAALLAEEHGIEVTFLETTAVCIERVSGRAEAAEHLGVDDNPYLATVGLRVQPAPVGHGVEFRPGEEPGRLLPAFVAATEEAVRATLRQGLHAWEVADAVVTMTASRYYPRQSHAHQQFSKAMSSVGADFRGLTPVVLMAALQRAGTVVCEPVHRFELEVPAEAMSGVMSLLGRVGAAPLTTEQSADRTVLGGEVAAARLRELTGPLPDLTRGEAVFTSEHDHYRPVHEADPPRRRRQGLDPRERKRWFREVPR